MSWIVCGLGPIGVAVACEAARIQRLAAIADLREEARAAATSALPVKAPAYPSLGAAVDRHRGATVLLCTSSGFREILPDVGRALAAGCAVLTSCEEACWPFDRFADDAARLDAEARRAGCAVLGAGINPGFLMDALPAIVAAPYPEPERLRIVRRVNVAERREPLQRKVGVGLGAEEFAAQARAGTLGHRGLAESLGLLGAALGTRWDRIECSIEPVLAVEPLSTPSGRIAEGRVIGMRNFGSAWRGDRVRIELQLTMAYGLADPVDRIEVLGPPPLPATIEFKGGVPGDIGTVRILCSLAERMAELPRKLCTMLDVPGGVRGWWLR